jgi:hypothetical protein
MKAPRMQYSPDLSDHAFDCLKSIFYKGRPTQEFNPGVCGKLINEGLATVEMLPSPYATHKGKKINFLVITSAGKVRANKWGGF